MSVPWRAYGGQRTAFGSRRSFYRGFRVLNSGCQACADSTSTHCFCVLRYDFKAPKGRGCTVEDDFELLTLTPLPPKCWDYS